MTGKDSGSVIDGIVAQLRAHGGDGRGIAVTVEDGGAGHEHVRTRPGDLRDVGHANPTINLKADGIAGVVDDLAHLSQLPERGRDELLTSEAGVHRHQQDHVDLVQQVLQALYAAAGIEDQAGLAALVTDQLQGTVDVAGGLGVKRDNAGASLGEVHDELVYGRCHQVHVNGRLDAVVAQCLAYHRSDGEVGHIVIVHDVKVNDVRSRC